MSVSGLRATGYSLHLTDCPWLERWHKWVCDLKYYRGLHYIQPLKTEHASNYRSWAPSDEARQLSTRLWAEVCAGTKTTSDYWKIEGTTAIRVHTKPRRAKFTSTYTTTYPGSGRETDPWFDLLGPTRTTIVRFRSEPAQTIELCDDLGAFDDKRRDTRR